MTRLPNIHAKLTKFLEETKFMSHPDPQFDPENVLPEDDEDKDKDKEERNNFYK